HLILALAPFNHNGVLPPQLYHQYFAFTHFLAACFMFALIRELGLSRFAAVVAGVCYSLGGFLARMGWPHMLESSIWLPLAFLLLSRSAKAERLGRSLKYASGAGLIVGISILAGGFHVVIVQGLILVSGAAYSAFARPDDSGLARREGPGRWPALVAG